MFGLSARFDTQKPSTSGDGVSPMRGVAMVEMAIIAPLFLLLLICVVDISYAIFVHTELVEIAKEGVRAGSSIPYMEPANWKCDLDLTLDLTAAGNPPEKGCALSDSTDGGTTWTAEPYDPVSPPAQGRLLIQIAELIRYQYDHYQQDRWSGMSIQTNPVIETSANYANPALIKICVDIKATYVGLFYLFRRIPIEVKACGPYTT